MTYEEALALFKDHEYWADISAIDEACEVAIEAIEKQIQEKSTADVRPVVHAKWIASERQRFINSDVAATDENGRPFIKKKLVKTVRYKCSSCNEISDDNSLYCPNCGADMRGN